MIANLQLHDAKGLPRFGLVYYPCVSARESSFIVCFTPRMGWADIAVGFFLAFLQGSDYIFTQPLPKQ